MQLTPAIFIFLVLALVWPVSGHARVSDPPQRGSLWRYPEYAWANPGKPRDDSANVCGDKAVTNQYVGACGYCGDPITDPSPRKHEIGGEYERGIVVKNYTAGELIEIHVDITAGHGGWFDFKLCPYSVYGEESDECFDQHQLLFANGSTRADMLDGFMKPMYLQLPAGVTCDHRHNGSFNGTGLVKETTNFGRIAWTLAFIKYRISRQY